MTQTLMRGLVWALLGLLAACSDGYPTDDAPRLAPSTMSRAQLLQALNELGAEPHLGQRWRYGLGPGCELEVRVHKDRGARHRVVLEGARIESSSQDGQIGVRVVPGDANTEADAEGEGAAGGVTVLETRRWTDSVRARALLTQLAMRCAEGVAEPAAPQPSVSLY